jgi:hypothetical protein
VSAAPAEKAAKPVTVQLVDVLRTLYTGKNVRLERRHGTQHLCPVCKDDLMRVAVVDLIYSFELCSCGSPEYEHLVEQLWHRACMIDGGVR